MRTSPHPRVDDAVAFSAVYKPEVLSCENWTVETIKVRLANAMKHHNKAMANATVPSLAALNEDYNW